MKIVRVPGNDEIWIKRVLDTGCDGILVPMVNTAEEARKVVRSAKYPLEGKRSVGLSRAHKYGAGFMEYVKTANKDIVIMTQIEHKDGVKNLDEILKVEGLDSLFIGPFDLSASMGLTGQVSHPDVVSAISTVKKKCLKAGMPYGIFSADKDIIISEIKDGCVFPAYGVDSATLLNSFTDSLKIIRKAR